MNVNELTNNIDFPMRIEKVYVDTPRDESYVFPPKRKLHSWDEIMEFLQVKEKKAICIDFHPVPRTRFVYKTKKKCKLIMGTPGDLLFYNSIKVGELTVNQLIHRGLGLRFVTKFYECYFHYIRRTYDTAG